MEFEPPVLMAIEREKRAVRIRSLAVSLPSAAGFVIIITLPYVLMRGSGGLDTASRKALFALVMLIYLGFFSGVYLAYVHHMRSVYNKLISGHMTDTFNLALQKFKDGAAAAGIAVGFNDVRVYEMDVPGAGLASFIGPGGTPSVGVDPGVLDSGISVPEAEALMASEVARFLIGDVIQPPTLTSLERMWSVLPHFTLTTYAFLIALSILLPRVGGYEEYPASGPVVLVVVPVVLVLGLVFATYVISTVFGASGRRMHQDLLCDSLACRITSNPPGLMSGVIKLKDERLLGRAFLSPSPPEGRGYGSFNRLDITAYVAAALRRTFQRKAYLVCEEPDESSILERLANIDEIVVGRYRCFDGSFETGGPGLV